MLVQEQERSEPQLFVVVGRFRMEDRFAGGVVLHTGVVVHLTMLEEEADGVDAGAEPAGSRKNLSGEMLGHFIQKSLQALGDLFFGAAVQRIDQAEGIQVSGVEDDVFRQVLTQEL